MYLLLIRHGETEHNVAGLLAGVTDSRLTNHGMLQAQNLGHFLIHQRKLQFTHVFSSNLQRAYMTAGEIEKSQNDEVPKARKDVLSKQASRSTVKLVQLPILQEQDFGSMELVSWSSRRVHETGPGRPRIPSPSDPGFRSKEMPEALTRRADVFLDDYFVPLMAVDRDQALCVAIVSHGLFLGSLWRALLARFESKRVKLGSGVFVNDESRPLGHLPSWTNTGYLELQITLQHESTTQHVELHNPALSKQNNVLDAKMIVLAINRKDHLSNLKRARGGIGSAKHDNKQRKIDDFFSRSKVSAIKNGAKVSEKGTIEHSAKTQHRSETQR